MNAVTWLASAPRSPRPHWLIQCAPHIMTRLKRVFERIHKGEHGSVLLADTPENSRELLWFLQRYPMYVTDPQRLSSQAAIHCDREELTAKILSGDYTPPATTPMALPARQYQQVAADLVCANGFLLLADDLGLGKTVSAITALAKHGQWPALVVTLTHLPSQWEREINRFCPSLKTHIVKKGKPYSVDADVLIINYHKLSGWAEHLAEMPVRAVVYDECQELRRGESLKYEAACHISAHSSLRLGLSATPIFNFGGEIYNVLSAISEDCLGTAEEFHREWCVGYSDKPKLRDPKAFGLYARDAGLMLRRTRADVGRELPSLSVFPHEVETDKREFAKFGLELASLARTILSTEQLEKGAKFRASGELDYKLRRQTGMAKADYTAAFVRMLVESGERVVLYGWHHDVYQVWRHALREYLPAFYTGKESAKEKESEINRFIAGETPIAILSLRAGAGLDGLQHVCRTVVFGELDWSPGVHEQAIGRVHRDGQKEPVCAYFLIADSGSDPIVADTLGVKRGQIDGLRDPDAPLVEAGIDPNHIRRLAEEFLRQSGEVPAPPVPAPVKLPQLKDDVNEKDGLQLSLFGKAV